MLAVDGDVYKRQVFYCRHDVEETIKVFLEKIDEFNAMHGIIQAFPDIVKLSDIGAVSYTHLDVYKRQG